MKFFLIVLVLLPIFTQAQIITTIAGTGIAGCTGDGGPATIATLDYHNGVAVDGAGNVYLATPGCASIRKVSTSGIITTIAGGTSIGFGGDGGPATAARLFEPWSLASDSIGNIYIADYGNSRIRKVNTAGIINTIAGVGGVSGFYGDNGPATASTVIDPEGVAVDGIGNVYITEAGNHRIRKVNSAGIITTIAGNGTLGYTGDGGPATAAQISLPLGICLDGPGNVYFTDGNNNCVRKISTSGIITTIAGTGTAGYSGDGGPAILAKLNAPWGVFADASEGNVYINDNNRLRKIDGAGIITTIAGTGTAGFSGDGGPAIAAQFSGNSGLARDCGGNFYIGDWANNRTRKITYAHAPYFTAGSHSLMICENSGAVSINALLSVMDVDTLQTLDWSVVTSAIHGIVAASYSSLTTGGLVTPTGLFYKPDSNYIGNDSFTVLVSRCGYLSATVTIYVAVNPRPVVNAINGPDSVCANVGTITLSNSTAGGVWSASGPVSIGASTGVVTGITAGMANISYTVTISGCSTVVGFPVMVVVCSSDETSPYLSIGGELIVYPNPAGDVLNIKTSNKIKSVVIMNLIEQIVYDHTYDTGKVSVNISNLPKGLYLVRINGTEVRKFVKE